MNDLSSPDTRPVGPDRWEMAVQAAARAFPYPPTPDLAASVRERLGQAGGRRRSAGPARRLAWALVVLALVLAALLAVPQVRAAIIEALQIGAIRIFVTQPTPSLVPPTATPGHAAAAPPVIGSLPATPAGAEPSASAASPATQPLTATPRPAPTPRPTPTPLASLLDLEGETTLDRAQRGAGFTIRRPAYPPDLGPPDHVFLQDLGGPVVVLVWPAPGQPGRVRLSLHEFGPNTYAEKMPPTVVQETTVNGQRAVWTEGPHMFVLKSGDMGPRELVHGHTLIWQQGRITLRLETDLGLPEALRIAESVR